MFACGAGMVFGGSAGSGSLDFDGGPLGGLEGRADRASDSVCALSRVFCVRSFSSCRDFSASSSSRLRSSISCCLRLSSRSVELRVRRPSCLGGLKTERGRWLVRAMSVLARCSCALGSSGEEASTRAAAEMPPELVKRPLADRTIDCRRDLDALNGPSPLGDPIGVVVILLSMLTDALLV